MTQRQIAMIGGRAISNDLPAFDVFALEHHRSLVDTGRLVRAIVFTQPVDTFFALVSADHNTIPLNAGHLAVFISDQHLTAIMRASQDGGL